MSMWMVDAFFWLVLPIAALEAARIIRLELKQERRTLGAAFAFGGAELVALCLCAATASPLFLAGVTAARVVLYYLREGNLGGRRPLKSALIAAGLLLLAWAGPIESFAQIVHVDIAPVWRHAILGLIGLTCVLTTLPVRIADEPKETLVAPLSLIAFARVILPLGSFEPEFVIVVPVVAAGMSLICALWLLSAGARANQFEPSTLVSEILICERGVILSFVWMGLASGIDLAEVGALFQWWAGALALLALEASLRRRPLPKPMAFFALAMTVSLPGTIGFVAEDLLAQGLLELRPYVAAAFMGVTAINAAALYLALVNIIVDLHAGETPFGSAPREASPSLMMLTTAALALAIGLAPSPFVDLATRAHTAVVHHPTPASHAAHG
ncbi:MAG: hypothetical protein H6748_21630 [Spirochaetaceae bacterium]|nr:hypothetical protein [Myxococcales bacterium]MCB9726661.1 hypothetical protein [Spirochaetaceae bacterium]HPG25219.1 hypothetical protein [Myxococcota bacterium]